MWGNRFGPDLYEVMGCPPQDNNESDLESVDDIENLVVAPPPSEKTLSTSKKLHFDARSADSQSNNNHMHPGFSNLEKLENKLYKKLYEVEAWDWPSLSGY